MENKNTISRRNFLGMSASFGALAALSNFNFAQAQTSPADYKALVCVFLFGGNDGHNAVVPLSGGEYTAYQNLRGGLSLAPNELLAINSGNVPYGLHYGLPELQNLYVQNKMAIVANVGNLVKPTSKTDLTELPTQLFSHADQIVQMQNGSPNGALGTGWGGRTADTMLSTNANSNFPPSVSFNGTALFCAGAQAQSASLQPGNDLRQNAMTFYPQSAADARFQAQKEILAAASSFNLVNGANKVLSDSIDLNVILRNTGSGGISTQFPGTNIGNQLKEAARIISLRTTIGINRQVFFCGLGGFDTHSAQDYTQWDLLRQLSQALGAFYTATEELGISNQVTTFTASEFGRTLQPSGSGSDHGWGSHHFVLGGAVKGGAIHGAFPTMAINAPHFYDQRGILIPQISLAQYGATLAKWFGVSDAQLNTIFPTLANFSVRDLAFML
jgi:uncharacterized protein (DUF1501 family)